MLKAINDLRKAMDPRKGGNQKAFYLIAETLMDMEKRMCLMESVVGKEARHAMQLNRPKGKPPQRKDGTECPRGTVAYTEDGSPVEGWLK